MLSSYREYFRPGERPLCIKNGVRCFPPKVKLPSFVEDHPFVAVCCLTPVQAVCQLDIDNMVPSIMALAKITFVASSLFTIVHANGDLQQRQTTTLYPAANSSLVAGWSYVGCYTYVDPGISLDRWAINTFFPVIPPT